jgi:hypothetical protein
MKAAQKKSLSVLPEADECNPQFYVLFLRFIEMEKIPVSCCGEGRLN